MKISTLLLVTSFLCAPTGAQSIDLGGLLNQVIQEENKTAGQPAPARQPQNSAPPQQGNTTGKDNASNLSHESQSSEIKVVEVEGVGENQQKAKEDAYRNAVEKAVGSFVSADLVAKNDQLIKDEVLNFSAGYIEKSEVISEGKRPDGLYSIKLRASVAKKKLTRQLEKLNIATADVDSESIFAEAITTSNQRDSAQKIWAKLFDDFWSKAFEVEVSGKPQLAYGPDDNVQAYFKVVVRFNKQFLQELENTIKGTGSSIRNEFVSLGGQSAVKQGYSRVCLVHSTDYTDLDGPRSRAKDGQLEFSYLDNGVSQSFWPIDQRLAPEGKNGYVKYGDGICAEIPINIGAWKLPPPQDFDDPFNPSSIFAMQGVYTVNNFMKYETPYILLTAQNKSNEVVASSAGVLVGDSNKSGSGNADDFISLHKLNSRVPVMVIFMGDRVNVRYIPVKLKRNQLQEIVKVEVRAVGKLIYADPANLEGKGKSREGLGNSDRSDRKYR